MNINEVEETLKSTIDYSNNELKRKKKKYVVISSLVILVIVFTSLISLIFIKKNNDIAAVVDRDTIHDIDYYSNYKTVSENSNGEKLELIIMKLPLKWKERTFETNNGFIKINYNVSYKEVVQAYNDENYVKLAMIDIASVIFTTVSDVDKVEIKYTDYSYSITREILEKVYNISNFDEVIKIDKWTELVSNKLINNEFVKKTFKSFKKKKVS